MRKFLKTVPMKLYLLIAAIILFAFFSNDFGLVDIQKTAIILAVGIDKSEEKFRLTSQIAVPKGSDRSTGGTSSVEIETEGETVSDCFTQLFSKTGWVPKLVFCDLIVLGEDAVKEDILGYLNYFLRNQYMPDSCLLAVCEGTANELIASQSAIDDASSLAIEKLFSDASEKSGNVLTTTLKEFAIGYYGVSKSGYLPFLRAQEQKGSQDSAAGGGSSGSSGSSGGSGSEEQKIYSAEETALFSEGKMVGILSREETLAFSLLSGNVSTGTLDINENGKWVTLNLLSNQGGVSLEMQPSPKADLSVSVTVRLCCRGTTAPIEDVSTDEVPAETIKRAEETLRGYLDSLWKTVGESGCDLFHLKRDLYRSSLKKYAEWKDSLLRAVEPQISAVVRTAK